MLWSFQRWINSKTPFWRWLLWNRCTGRDIWIHWPWERKFCNAWSSGTENNIWVLVPALPRESDAASAGFSLCSQFLSPFFSARVISSTRTLTPAGSLYMIPTAKSGEWGSSFKKDLTCSSGFFHVRGTKGRQMWETSQGNLSDRAATKAEDGGVETPKHKLSCSHLAHTWFSNQAQIKVTNTCTWFSFNPVSSSQHSTEYSLLNRNTWEPKENFLLSPVHEIFVLMWRILV